MAIKFVKKKCLWCKEEYQGRSYQEFCGTSCSDKSYYWHKKQGLTRKISQIKCNVCETYFEPKRNNVKRCSQACRSAWIRISSSKSYKKKRDKALARAEAKRCPVCSEFFKSTSNRKTCGKKCSKLYNSYSVRKRLLKLESRYGKPYNMVEVPLPEHDPIPVGDINLESSKDLESAVSAFVKGGGKVRKFHASTETDLLNDNLLETDIISEVEIQDQLSGIVRIK